MKYTPGLWKHITYNTTFAICVDNFIVNYFSQDNSNIIVHEVKSYYEFTVDLANTLFCGINLKWNYAKV